MRRLRVCRAVEAWRRLRVDCGSARLVESLRMLLEEGIGLRLRLSWKIMRLVSELRCRVVVPIWLMRKVVVFSLPSVLYLFDLRILIGTLYP